MNKLVNKEAKGFTIIEVVLVLAIAGLIFLVVFLALPALQRSQRDTQRKSDLGRFMSQVTNYSSNNQGSLPGATSAAWNTFVGNYLTNNNQSFSDPQSGSTYTVTYSSTAPTSAVTLTAGNINVYAGSICGGSFGAQSGGGSRTFAALIYEEQGGYYCQNN